MNREEYLRELARELRRLPRDEYEKAMDYYVEYFADAGPEHEAETISDLGSPKEVAAQIIRDAAMERMDHPQKSVKRGFSTVWIVILAICGAPIALPIAIAIIALIGSILVMIGAVLVGLVVLTVGCLASGIVSVVCGIIIMIGHPVSGLACMGTGFMIVGVSILGGIFLAWLVKWLFKGVRALFRKIVKRGKKS